MIDLMRKVWIGLAGIKVCQGSAVDHPIRLDFIQQALCCAGGVQVASDGREPPVKEVLLICSVQV